MNDPFEAIVEDAFRALGGPPSGTVSRANQFLVDVKLSKAEMLPMRQGDSSDGVAASEEWRSTFGLTYNSDGTYTIYTPGTTPQNSKCIAISGAWVALQCDGNFTQYGTEYIGSDSGVIVIEIDRLNVTATLQLVSWIPDNTASIEYIPLWYVPTKVDGAIPEEYTVDLRHSIRITGMA